MRTLRMIDSATPQNLAAARAAGIEAAAAYIGGATPHVWTTDELKQLAQFDLRVFIYVPPQDPRYYAAATGAADMHAYASKFEALVAAGLAAYGDVVLVDIEEPMYAINPGGVNEYLQAWVTGAPGPQVAPGVYGPRAAFLGWPAEPRMAWVAEWLEPSGQFSGTWPDAPTPAEGLAPISAWQFAGGVELPDVGVVDLSVVAAPDNAVPGPIEQQAASAPAAPDAQAQPAEEETGGQPPASIPVTVTVEARGVSRSVTLSVPAP